MVFFPNSITGGITAKAQSTMAKKDATSSTLAVKTPKSPHQRVPTRPTRCLMALYNHYHYSN